MKKRVIDRDNREAPPAVAPARAWWLWVLALGCILAGVRWTISLLGASSVACLSLFQLAALLPISFILIRATALRNLGCSAAAVSVAVAMSFLGAGLAIAWWLPYDNSRPFALLVRSPKDPLGTAARILMDRAGFQASAIRQLHSTESEEVPALLRAASGAAIAIQSDGDVLRVIPRAHEPPSPIPAAFPALSWVSLDSIIYTIPLAEPRANLIVRSLVDGELRIANHDDGVGMVSLIGAALLIKENLPEQLSQARAHVIEHMVRIALGGEHVDGLLLRCAQQMLVRISTNVFRVVRDKSGRVKRKLAVKGCREEDSALLNNRALIEVALFAYTRAGDEMLLKAKRSLLTAIRCAPNESHSAAVARANLAKLQAILPGRKDPKRSNGRRGQGVSRSREFSGGRRKMQRESSSALNARRGAREQPLATLFIE